jgi:hypothetical protein
MKPVLFKNKKNRISTGNHFEEGDFYPDELWNMQISSGLIHTFATLKNRLTYQCPSSWPVVITMKTKLAGTWKSYRILAGPNEWQQVCNRSNPAKTGRSCEGVDFSWLSSKVSRTLDI